MKHQLVLFRAILLPTFGPQSASKRLSAWVVDAQHLDVLAGRTRARTRWRRSQATNRWLSAPCRASLRRLESSCAAGSGASSRFPLACLVARKTLVMRRRKLFWQHLEICAAFAA